MKHVIRFSILAMALGIAGCVTSSGNVDPEMVTIARNVIADSCVLTRSKGTNIKQQEFVIDEIYISNIKEIRNGVFQASSFYRGFGSNITFDIKAALSGCGSNSETLYASKYLTAYLAKQGKKPEHRRSPNDNASLRSIAVKWEGYAALFSGTIEETGGGRGGTVFIKLPNNEGECSGSYKATSRTKGTWDITCTNDLAATGTFTAFGDGKGASGTGKDKRGRNVTYTIGGRT